MKKTLPLLLCLLLLTACGAGTDVPAVAPTATTPPTSAPTEAPTFSPSPTVEALPTPTLPPTEPPAAPQARVSAVDGMPQVFIPAGTFRMGGLDVRSTPEEKPAHDVTLDAFWMDQLEVTNGMYSLCVNAGACAPPHSSQSQRRAEYYTLPGFKDYPVVYVGWGEAKAYCEWAGRRLPTEAEWERAARGDDFRTFPWGEDKPDATFANFNFMVGDTTRVGTYPLGASPFGVLDMAGNVAEWVNDYYLFNYYQSAESANPTGPASSASYDRVVRGGSLGDAEINIRLSKRSSVQGPVPNAPLGSSEQVGAVSPRIGFRCAVDE